MPTRRDNAAERAARIDWLVEENRTKFEATATAISQAIDHFQKASQRVKANLDAVKQRRRASKA